MGARKRVGRGLSYRPARLHTQPGGIGSLESILGFLKSLKIRAQAAPRKRNIVFLQSQKTEILYFFSLFGQVAL
jgi:hypothetical protein